MCRIVYLNPAPLVHRSNMSSASSKNEATYSIAELAREFDLTPRAIRHYEEQGLITPADRKSVV
jgi:hypothetical protein